MLACSPKTKLLSKLQECYTRTERKLNLNGVRECYEQTNIVLRPVMSLRVSATHPESLKPRGVCVYSEKDERCLSSCHVFERVIQTTKKLSTEDFACGLKKREASFSCHVCERSVRTARELTPEVFECALKRQILSFVLSCLRVYSPHCKKVEPGGLRVCCVKTNIVFRPVLSLRVSAALQ